MSYAERVNSAHVEALRALVAVYFADSAGRSGSPSPSFRVEPA